MVKKEQRDLGKVLVTIDGLQALRDEIKRIDGGGGDPMMEFNGGTFDEPGDLRTLSDLELQQLAVKGTAVEVHLSRTSAQAVGYPNASEAVYNHWARSRQTKQRATRPKWNQIITTVIAGFIGLFFSIGSIAILLDPQAQLPAEDPSLPHFPAPVERYLAVAVAAGIGALMLFIAKEAPREQTGSYAIVRAVTEDEYRKERATAVRHWQNATITLAAVSATLLVGFLTLLFKK